MTNIPPTSPIAQQPPLPSAGPTRTCPKCQMQVPAKAYVCAYCKKRLRTSPVTWVCLVLFGLPILTSVLSRSTSTPPAPAPKSTEDAKRGAAAQKAQQETPPSALNIIRKAEVMRAVRLEHQWRKGVGFSRLRLGSRRLPLTAGVGRVPVPLHSNLGGDHYEWA